MLRQPCPNGAADWLYTAGICLLVSAILIPCMIGGVIAGVWPLAIPLLGLVIMEFSILIWGSVVVFGAYKDWTYDVEKYSENFCEYRPMMFAFVILILKWVRSDEDNIYRTNMFLMINFRYQSELCNLTFYGQ